MGKTKEQVFMILNFIKNYAPSNKFIAIVTIVMILSLICGFSSYKLYIIQEDKASAMQLELSKSKEYREKEVDLKIKVIDKEIDQYKTVVNMFEKSDKSITAKDFINNECKQLTTRNTQILSEAQTVLTKELSSGDISTYPKDEQEDFKEYMKSTLVKEAILDTLKIPGEFLDLYDYSKSKGTSSQALAEISTQALIEVNYLNKYVSEEKITGANFKDVALHYAELKDLESQLGSTSGGKVSDDNEGEITCLYDEYIQNLALISLYQEVEGK